MDVWIEVEIEDTADPTMVRNGRTDGFVSFVTTCSSWVDYSAVRVGGARRHNETFFFLLRDEHWHGKEVFTTVENMRFQGLDSFRRRLSEADGSYKLWHFEDDEFFGGGCENRSSCYACCLELSFVLFYSIFFAVVMWPIFCLIGLSCREPSWVEAFAPAITVDELQHAHFFSPLFLKQYHLWFSKQWHKLLVVDRVLSWEVLYIRLPVCVEKTSIFFSTNSL